MVARDTREHNASNILAELKKNRNFKDTIEMKEVNDINNEIIKKLDTLLQVSCNDMILWSILSFWNINLQIKILCEVGLFKKKKKISRHLLRVTNGF